MLSTAALAGSVLYCYLLLGDTVCTPDTLWVLPTTADSVRRSFAPVSPNDRIEHEDATLEILTDPSPLVAGAFGSPQSTIEPTSGLHRTPIDTPVQTQPLI